MSCSNASHSGTSKPRNPSKWWAAGLVQIVDHLFRHRAMTFVDHVQCVCTRRPVCGLSGTCGTAESETTQRQRKRHAVFDQANCAIAWNIQQRGEARPQPLIVQLGKLDCTFRSNHPQEIVRTSRPAMQQQSPSTLQIWDGRGLVQELLMFGCSDLQLLLDIRWVTQRCAKHL